MLVGWGGPTFGLFLSKKFILSRDYLFSRDDVRDEPIELLLNVLLGASSHLT